MYEKGKGVKQDDFKALKFYQKACGLNDGGGCSNLGLSYEKGKGVKQDDFKALKFYLLHKCNKNVSHLLILNGHFYCMNVTKMSVFYFFETRLLFHMKRMFVKK
jgi:hypothetical protein